MMLIISLDDTRSKAEVSYLRRLQYNLIFSLYATFNMIFVSIISTVHVSARIGHLQVLIELYLFMLTY
jgi:hypothetical protein